MNLPALRANWRTTLSGIGAALFAALTALAALPYQLGDVATIIPAEWKPVIFKWSLIATIILKVWNAVASKDSTVSGNGTLADPARDARSQFLPLLIAALLPACLFTACMGVSVGATYQRPDGSAITGTVKLDPSFATQKKGANAMRLRATPPEIRTFDDQREEIIPAPRRELWPLIVTRLP